MMSVNVRPASPSVYATKQHLCGKNVFRDSAWRNHLSTICGKCLMCSMRTPSWRHHHSNLMFFSADLSACSLLLLLRVRISP